MLFEMLFDKTKINTLFVYLLFKLFELCAFLAPALPSNIWVRLTILGTYLVAHYFKIHVMYAKFKLLHQ